MEKQSPSVQTTAQNSIKLGYRQDIDGLRAIAVIAIVAFHAFPSLIPGGFVGVDIFFVISGFLITSLILQKQHNKIFSLTEFYASRIRRIFPALILVMSASLAFGWIALLADEYKMLGKHIAASAVFIPNFIFWSESGYFDYAAATKPLLHLWSLGIEEQFYLLWPLLAGLCFRYKINLVKVSGVIFLTSLLINLLMIEVAASATFFSPLSRIWELLAGCLLALFMQSKTSVFETTQHKFLEHNYMNHGLTTLGLLLILCSLFLFDQDFAFPGGWALIPVTGSVLIILAGEKAWLNSSVLSNKIVVGVGLISFPLYLWHWPLLSFARIISGTTPDWPLQLALVISSFVLAFLSTHFLERPIRFGRKTKTKVTLLVIAMFIMGGVGLATFLKSGFEGRISNQEVKAQLADLNFDIPDSTGWYCNDLQFDSPRCHSTGPNPSVVVIGDSHALTIYSGLRNLFKAKGQDIGLYGASDGCPPLLNVVIQDQGGDFRNCLKKGTQAIQRIIADPSIREVILTSRGPMYTTGLGYGDIESTQFGNWVLHFEGVKQGESDNSTVFSMGLTKTLDALLAAGKKVTFLHDVPELGFDIRRCFSFRPLSISSNEAHGCSLSRTDFEKRTSAFKTMVDKILAQRPEVKVIDLAKALCDEKRCYGSKDGVLFYIDDDHLSHRGSAYVVNKLRDEF